MNFTEQERSKFLSKQIEAMLKVGETNAMHWDDIKIHLEHAGIKFKDYEFKDALHYIGPNVASDYGLMWLEKNGNMGYYY